MQVKRNIADPYTLESLEKVVCVVAKEAGFKGIEPHCLEIYSNLLGAYIENLLTTAHRQAELGNRSKPNIHDITRSIEKAGTDLDTFKNYLLSKVNDTPTFRRLKKYFKAQKQESTVESVPEFLPSDNENSEDEDETTREDGEEDGLPAYVPRHFPSFPSKHSFRQTPIYIDRPDDPQKVRELNSEQSRTVEENLKKLMSAENKLLRRQHVNSHSSMMLDDDFTFAEEVDKNALMPIVNYETFMQRRKRQKQSGTSLNVGERPASTTIKVTTENGDVVMEERTSNNATSKHGEDPNGSDNRAVSVESVIE